MSAEEATSVTLNGRVLHVERGTRLVEWMESQGLDPHRVAVERNREVVPRSALPGIAMEPGDVFEVVHFVGGG